MLTKSMLKKSFMIECDHCGAINQSSINDLTCKNPDCGYQMKPSDDLLMSLFGKAVMIIEAQPSRMTRSTFSASTGILPVELMGSTVIDESKWNWRYDGVNEVWIPPDYDKAKNQTDMIYIIKKASQATWDDPTWEIGKPLILQRDIGLGAYHYCDAAFDAIQSAIRFATQANDILFDYQFGTTAFPQYWADIESNRGSGSTPLTPNQMANWAYSFVSEFEQRSGWPIGIYTREIWWNDYVARNTWAHLHALWIARYNSWISEPGEPKDWSNYGKKPVLWQWSADGNGRGSHYGYQSNSIDMNRSPLMTTEQIQAAVYGGPGNPPPGLPQELLIKDPSTNQEALYRQV